MVTVGIECGECASWAQEDVGVSVGGEVFGAGQKFVDLAHVASAFEQNEGARMCGLGSDLFE